MTAGRSSALTGDRECLSRSAHVVHREGSTMHFAGDCRGYGAPIVNGVCRPTSDRWFSFGALSLVFATAVLGGCGGGDDAQSVATGGGGSGGGSGGKGTGGVAGTGASPNGGAAGSSGSAGSGGSSGGSDAGNEDQAWNAPVGDAVVGVTLYDGWQDLRMVPAPVNVSGGWTDSVAVTPDGLHLYFGYSRYDFTKFFKSVKAGGPVVLDPSGPPRTGMTGNAFKIFRADLESGAWTVSFHPVNDPNGDISEASASPSAGGDLLVWSRFDAGGVATLFLSNFSGGKWGPPLELPAGTPVKINGGCSDGGDDNGFWLGSPGGKMTLVWESHRATPDASTCGKERHLYRSAYDGVTWSSIEPVPGLDIFGGSDDSQVSFSPDAKNAYWTSVRLVNATPTYGLFTADFDGAAYTNVRLVATPIVTPPYTGNVVILGELNVADLPEGKIGYFMCGIAQSEDPNEIALSVCRMRKPK
jgi:hypothetical protein